MISISNSDLPLVSIIVITYNSSKYVLETLESAKAQTYQNIELIVSDDCSTDNTVEICRKWIAKNHINFIRTELITALSNKGIPTNCNCGIKVAKGDWVKLIAGDDILLKTCIKDNLSFVSKNSSAHFITSELEYIDKDSNILSHFKYDSYNNIRKYYFTLTANKQLKLYSRIPLFLNSPAFFIKKTAIIEVGYYDEEFSIFEDMCLIYKLNEKGWKVYHLERHTVKYRISDSSISSQNNKLSNNTRHIELKLIFEKYRKKYLSILNILDLTVYFDIWLRFYYKGIFGHKGVLIIKNINILNWYLKYLNFQKRILK
ncbi:MAG TPA: glycosyltransferase [Candidatus Paceibacterota bacterium]